MPQLKTTDPAAAGAMGRSRVWGPWAESRSKLAGRRHGGGRGLVGRNEVWHQASRELHGMSSRRKIMPQRLKAPTVGLEPTTTRLRALRSAG